SRPPSAWARACGSCAGWCLSAASPTSSWAATSASPPATWTPSSGPAGSRSASSQPCAGGPEHGDDREADAQWQDDLPGALPRPGWWAAVQGVRPQGGCPAVPERDRDGQGPGHLDRPEPGAGAVPGLAGGVVGDHYQPAGVDQGA